MMRIAWRVRSRTKEQTKEVFETLNDEGDAELTGGFVSSISVFESWLSLLKTTESRLLVAASAVIENGEKKGTSA